MKRLLIVFVLLLGAFITAAFMDIPVSVSKTTDEPVPVSILMGDLLEFVGFDFDANWDSLRILDSGDLEIPYQIDDADMNGKLSSGDVLVFLIHGPITIRVSDDFSFGKPSYESKITVMEEEGEWILEGEILKAKVNGKGLVRITGVGMTEGTILDEIGIARVSGWVGSTYYIDGEFGRHEEKTSGDFNVTDIAVLPGGPVGVTVVANLYSDLFVGFEQLLITTVFVNGDIMVHNTFKFNTYADMMKLHLMVTRPLTDIAEDTVHILPVFRRLTWADQLGITPMEYWKERNAIMIVNNSPFIVFPAIDSMKPLWWGATYIFASEENWRANYSPTLKMGVAEIFPEKPVLYVNYDKWLKGPQWIYESREFRDGYFMWMPGEFQAYESTKGVGEGWENFVMHHKAGDEVKMNRIYSLFMSDSIEDAVDHLDLRTLELQSLKIGE